MKKTLLNQFSLELFKPARLAFMAGEASAEAQKEVIAVVDQFKEGAKNLDLTEAQITEKFNDAEKAIKEKAKTLEATAGSFDEQEEFSKFANEQINALKAVKEKYSKSRATLEASREQQKKAAAKKAQVGLKEAGVDATDTAGAGAADAEMDELLGGGEAKGGSVDVGATATGTKVDAGTPADLDAMLAGLDGKTEYTPDALADAQKGFAKLKETSSQAVNDLKGKFDSALAALENSAEAKGLKKLIADVKEKFEPVTRIPNQFDVVMKDLQKAIEHPETRHDSLVIAQRDYAELKKFAVEAIVQLDMKLSELKGKLSKTADAARTSLTNLRNSIVNNLSVCVAKDQFEKVMEDLQGPGELPLDADVKAKLESKEARDTRLTEIEDQLDQHLDANGNSVELPVEDGDLLFFKRDGIMYSINISTSNEFMYSKDAYGKYKINKADIVSADAVPDHNDWKSQVPDQFEEVMAELQKSVEPDLFQEVLNAVKKYVAEKELKTGTSERPGTVAELDEMLDKATGRTEHVSSLDESGKSVVPSEFENVMAELQKSVTPDQFEEVMAVIGKYNFENEKAENERLGAIEEALDKGEYPSGMIVDGVKYFKEDDIMHSKNAVGQEFMHEKDVHGNYKTTEAVTGGSGVSEEVADAAEAARNANLASIDKNLSKLPDYFGIQDADGTLYLHGAEGYLVGGKGGTWTGYAEKNGVYTAENYDDLQELIAEKVAAGDGDWDLEKADKALSMSGMDGKKIVTPSGMTYWKEDGILRSQDIQGEHMHPIDADGNYETLDANPGRQVIIDDPEKPDDKGKKGPENIRKAVSGLQGKDKYKNKYYFLEGYTPEGYKGLHGKDEMGVGKEKVPTTWRITFANSAAEQNIRLVDLPKSLWTDNFADGVKVTSPGPNGKSVNARLVGNDFVDENGKHVIIKSGYEFSKIEKPVIAEKIEAEKQTKLARLDASKALFDELLNNYHGAHKEEIGKRVKATQSNIDSFKYQVEEGLANKFSEDYTAKNYADNVKFNFNKIIERAGGEVLTPDDFLKKYHKNPNKIAKALDKKYQESPDNKASVDKIVARMNEYKINALTKENADAVTEMLTLSVLEGLDKTGKTGKDAFDEKSYNDAHTIAKDIVDTFLQTSGVSKIEDEDRLHFAQILFAGKYFGKAVGAKLAEQKRAVEHDDTAERAAAERAKFHEDTMKRAEETIARDSEERASKRAKRSAGQPVGQPAEKPARQPAEKVENRPLVTTIDSDGTFDADKIASLVGIEKDQVYVVERAAGGNPEMRIFWLYYDGKGANDKLDLKKGDKVRLATDKEAKATTERVERMQLEINAREALDYIAVGLEDFSTSGKYPAFTKQIHVEMNKYINVNINGSTPVEDLKQYVAIDGYKEVKKFEDKLKWANAEKAYINAIKSQFQLLATGVDGNDADYLAYQHDVAAMADAKDANIDKVLGDSNASTPKYDDVKNLKGLLISMASKYPKLKLNGVEEAKDDKGKAGIEDADDEMDKLLKSSTP
ncbi:MAG: hypothetical protein WCT36_00755 [Candidatus Gracilibacteria bacterium]